MTSTRLWSRSRGCVCVTAIALLAATAGAWSAELQSPVVPPRFIEAWGQEGTADGQFKVPIGIAINAADEVFITDARKNCVQRFTRDGRFLDKVATGSFPGGIAIDREGLVYVAPMMDHKISVFRVKSTAPGEKKPASAFELVREWGRHGTGDGEFDQPGGLVFGRDGTLYVCDQVNHRVQRFSTDGRFLSKWGSYGSAPGQFGAPEPTSHRVGGPCTAAIDRDGNLFTTEPTAGRIQKFSPEGKYLGSWGSNEKRDGAFGGGANLQGPIGILFDREDRVWISATNHRVQLFTSTGRYLCGLGTTAVPGPQPGQFRTPHMLAQDSRGVLYVVDTINRRVQKFAFATTAK